MTFLSGYITIVLAQWYRRSLLHQGLRVSDSLRAIFYETFLTASNRGLRNVSLLVILSIKTTIDVWFGTIVVPKAHWAQRLFPNVHLAQRLFQMFIWHKDCSKMFSWQKPCSKMLVWHNYCSKMFITMQLIWDQTLIVSY